MSNLFKETKSEFIDRELEASEVPESFMQNLRAALKSPLFAVPKPFETWMIDKVASSGFDLPISQIVGFSGFTVQRALVTTSETTTSASYVDLATPGPTLTQLPDGQYLILTAVTLGANAGVALATPEINGVDEPDSSAAIHTGGAGSPLAACIGVTTATLGAGSNTIKLQYRVNDGVSTARFQNRNLIVLKFANL